MKMIIERARIEIPEKDTSRSEVFIGALRQYEPQAKNIKSATGRVKEPICGPNQPQKSVIVENMIKVVAKIFLWNLRRVISIDRARTAPTAKTPNEGMK